MGRRIAMLFVVFSTVTAAILADLVTEEQVEKAMRTVCLRNREQNGNFTTIEQCEKIGFVYLEHYLNHEDLATMIQNSKTLIVHLLTPDQITLLLDVFSNIVDVIGDQEKTVALIRNAINATVDYVAKEKKEVDDKIAELTAEKATREEIELTVLRMFFTHMTAQRKAEIRGLLSKMVSADQLGPIRTQLGRIVLL